jgi:PAS domain S-box-containing protein
LALEIEIVNSESTETILVVDDRPATRYSTTRVLKQAGFRVIEAMTGSEALKLAEQNCDLIVLDVNLPDIDGHEVCRRIRSNSKSARVPVVHLSATFISDDHKIRGLEAGADGYLTHPVDPLVLIATIKAFLRTRQVEGDLKRSEAKFRAIFDHALTGICLISNDMIFLDVNPAFCRIMGRSREEIIERHASAFVHSSDEGKVLEISQHLERELSWSGSLPLLRGDGKIAELEWNISIHSAPSVRLAIVTDVTEKRLIEAEREQLLESERAARTASERANRLKDEFLATLSHELRSPLNAIIGWSQVLRFAPPTEKDLAEGLETIERNAKVQAELINDLLDVSRIISGKLRLNVQKLDVASLVRDSIATVMPAARAKGVQIEQRLHAFSRPVYGDASRLQQVIWNLINNAVKFTPKNGMVRADIRQAGDLLEIVISDTGQGINPEFLPHLFERFRQEDATTTRSHGGLGLGLAIVKHLVELHGGTVTAHSVGEGQGSQFVVRLPMDVARQEEPVNRAQVVASVTSPPAEPEPVNLKQVRVLIVDDDQDSRMVSVRVLKEFHADVADADSAEHALRTIESFQPHVLVSDIGMPVMDGYDLIREVRRRGYSAEKLPAIAVTAFVRSEDRTRVLSDGYQIHLGKPIAPTALVTAIASLVTRFPR